LIDTLFIALSGAGVTAILNRPKVKAAIRWIGCLVLTFFGADMICGALDISLLPDLRLFAPSGGSLFWQGILLTASNPLTILFWSGMFSAQIIQKKWNTRQLAFFAAGCVLAPLVFLSAVAALGAALGGVLPEIVIRILNILVGAALIFYGLRLLLRTETAPQAR
jgi:threonine/homoserine/homoserine lactone efflux protein